VGPVHNELTELDLLPDGVTEAWDTARGREGQGEGEGEGQGEGEGEGRGRVGTPGCARPGGHLGEPPAGVPGEPAPRGAPLRSCWTTTSPTRSPTR